MLPRVRIDEKTTQEELTLLRRQITQRDFLMSTPLNVGLFLRCGVLWLLFPGMVFGFKIGMALTALFSACLMALLLIGRESVATSLAMGWLAAGTVVWCYTTVRTIRDARRTRRLRRCVRPARQGLKRPVEEPKNYPLAWRNEGGEQVTGMVLQAPRTGIYALLLKMRGYTGARLLADGTRGACLVHAEGKRGGDFYALMLYSLEAGRHELTWRTASGSPVEISQLNHVGR